jgi:hypothetical protein
MNDTTNEEGVKITIELSDLPPNHDREDPLCSIVAIIAFQNEKKQKENTLFLDMAENFVQNTRTSAPLLAWYESLESVCGSSKLQVTVEIRCLKQTIPLI